MNKTFILQLCESYATGTLVIVKPSFDDVKKFLRQYKKEYNEIQSIDKGEFYKTLAEKEDKTRQLFKDTGMTYGLDCVRFTESKDKSFWNVVKEFESNLPEGVIYSDYYSG